MRGIVCIFLVIILASSLNLDLPKLIKTSYRGHSLPPLNVTIGEKFSLPLPHFDTPWQNKSFQVYEIAEEEFNRFGPVKS
jgi:hypothetical protein